MGEKLKKRSFWIRLMLFFVGIFAIIGLCSMLLCVLNPMISPNKFVYSSFFGLAFWPIFFFNLLIIFLLLILKSKKTLLFTFLALILTLPGFLKSYSLKKASEDAGNLKVMSYNVAHFIDITDNQRDVNSVQADFIEMVKAQRPDLICLQECHFSKPRLVEFSQQLGYRYCDRINRYGNCIISKYPIKDDEYTKNFNALGNIGIAKLIDAGGLGEFYVECVHLKSFELTQDNLDYLNTKQYYNDTETKGKSLLFKLKVGFEKRTYDTKALTGNMPETGIPIIICGDFNDTPMSYTYRQMRKVGLHDAFLNVGHGIGKTYCNNLPLLRIDYIWYSDGVVPMTFSKIEKKMSDHYPISMTFNLTH